MQVPFGARLLCQMDQGHGLIDRFLFVAPHCLRPTHAETQAAALAVSQGPLQHLADVFLEISRLHENPRTYSFTQEAQDLLQTFHEQFIAEINEALKEGTTLPKCKKVDIVQRVAVAVHIFDHVCHCLLQGDAPTLPAEDVAAEALQHALKYVEWAEDQKTIFLDVSEVHLINLHCQIMDSGVANGGYL